MDYGDLNMGYYLLIKTIDQTGLKYLCKCRDNKNPFRYRGSGKLWKRILDRHPEYTITTEIVGHFNSNDELRSVGLKYSILHNIVEDAGWANCIPEVGDGGPTVQGRIRITNEYSERLIDPSEPIPHGWRVGGKKRGRRPIEVTSKIVQSQKGQKRSSEICDKFKQSWASGNRKPIPKKQCPVCERWFVAPNFNRHTVKCKDVMT